MRVLAAKQPVHPRVAAGISRTSAQRIIRNGEPAARGPPTNSGVLGVRWTSRSGVEALGMLIDVSLWKGSQTRVAKLVAYQAYPAADFSERSPAVNLITSLFLRNFNYYILKLLLDLNNYSYTLYIKLII